MAHGSDLGTSSGGRHLKGPLLALIGGLALAFPLLGAPPSKPAAPAKAKQTKASTAKATTAGKSLQLSSDDPRVVLHELWASGDPAAVLAKVDATLKANPTQARLWGYDHLKGRLLQSLGQKEEAAAAFTQALSTAPSLVPWSRFRLAQIHAGLGRPAMATALAASLLAAKPNRPLLEQTLDLFEAQLAAGGDCRMLQHLPSLAWRPEELRLLALARAECAFREKRESQALTELKNLLQAKIGDDPALMAATRLAPRLSFESTEGRTALLMGGAFYEHRDFTAAVKYLGRAISLGHTGYETQFSMARSLFWLEDHAAAAAAFGTLARSTTVAGERAQAYYHQGRSFELVALAPALDAVSQQAAWDQAALAFGEILKLVPDGRLANAAAVSLVRLEYLRGDGNAARARVAELVAKKRAEAASQTLMFLIASELSQGRTAEVAGWLATATRLGQAKSAELAYWQAKLDELEQRGPAAAEGYLRLAMSYPYDPIGQWAWSRAHQKHLAPIAERRARQLAASTRFDELALAWRYLGDTDADGAKAQHQLVAQLLDDPRAVPFLRLVPKAPAEWPLWRLPLATAEDQLAALGLWDEVRGNWVRYFPGGDPSLGLAGARAFTQAGAWHRGIYLAESLGKRAPSTLTPRLLPSGLRQAIYPLGPASLLRQEADKHHIEWALLAAIIREESRFDPDALSAASARGLTQFILPTARKMAGQLGLGELNAQDLHRPEISVALGAGHLAELAIRFRGHEPSIVAAYNAGAPQAQLWRRYCYSDDPVEYLSKVGFKETRDYLTKVLTSLAHYREIYPPSRSTPQPQSPNPSGK